MNEKIPEDTPIPLLYENVAKKDAFHGQTHEHVASTLASIIKTQQKGVTIGLEGAWGSGKSTVLYLLKEKLGTDAHVFVFDAWAHEGDILRRIFLESFLDAVIDAMPAQERKIDLSWFVREKEVVARRCKQTTTVSKRRLTGKGLAFLLAVFLLSFAGVVSNLIQLGTWAKVLSVGPILLVVCIFVVLIVWNTGWPMSNPLDPKKCTFFQQGSEGEEFLEISEDEERSSIEFGRIFSEIMEHVSSIDKRTKWVIAIDNLDRVDPKVALVLWSTLQTFLQRRNGMSKSSRSEDDWFSRLWLIVPFDQEAMARIWQTEDAQCPGSNTREDGADSKNMTTAKSFFDKCFQIRLDVPTPIMKDGVQYVKELVDETFSGWSRENRELLVNMLRCSRGDLEANLTPREIKNYLNQISVWSFHAGDKISLACIALFVIARYIRRSPYTVSEIKERLIQGKFILPRFRAYLPEDAEKQIAGLLFGVDADTGFDLLLKPSVEQALSDGDAEAFKELIERHLDSVKILFENILSQNDWTELWGLSGFLATCSTVFKSENSEFMDCFLHKRLRDIINNTEKYQWNYADCFFEMEETPDLVHLLDFVHLCINNSYDDVFVKWYDAFLLQLNTGFSSEIREGQTFVEFYRRLLALIPEGKRRLLETNGCEKDNLLALFNSMTDTDCAEWIYPSQNDLDSLSDLIEQGKVLSPALMGALDCLTGSSHCSSRDWRKFVDACRNHIVYGGGNFHSAYHSDWVTKFLLDVYCSGIDDESTDNQDAVQEVVRTSSFMNWVNTVNDVRIGIYGLLLGKIVLAKELTADTQQSRQYWAALARLKGMITSDNVNHAAESLLKYVSAYRLISEFLDITSRMGGVFARAVVDMALNNPEYQIVLKDGNPLEPVECLRSACSDSPLTEEEIRPLLDYMVDNRNLREHAIDKMKQPGELLNNTGYLEDLSFVINSSRVDGQFYAALNSAVSGWTTQEWNSLLLKDNRLRDFICRFKTKYSDAGFSLPFRDVILDVINHPESGQSEVGDKVFNEWTSEAWQIFASCLESKYQEHLARALLKHVDLLEEKDDEYWDYHYTLIQSVYMKVDDIAQIVWATFYAHREKMIDWALGLLIQSMKDNEFNPTAVQKSRIKDLLKLYAEEGWDDKKLLEVARLYKIDLEESEKPDDTE